mgnify:CR=1 FL=1
MRAGSVSKSLTYSAAEVLKGDVVYPVAEAAA